MNSAIDTAGKKISIIFTWDKYTFSLFLPYDFPSFLPLPFKNKELNKNLCTQLEKQHYYHLCLSMKFYWYTAMPITYILSATAFELQVETVRETTGSQSQKYSPFGPPSQKSFLMSTLEFFFLVRDVWTKLLSFYCLKSLCFALFSGILG